MNSILIIHIVAASILTIGGVILGVFGILRKKLAYTLGLTMTGFSATLVSGVVLVASTGKSLTYFCVTMTVYSLATFAVRWFYLQRTKNTLTLRQSDI